MKLFKKPKIKDLLPPPVNVSHGEYSMILSSLDDAKPNEELLEVSLKAIKKAKDIRFDLYQDRMLSEAFYHWPGEHYRLLAGFIKVLKPKNVIEVGTATGLSTLAMLSELPKRSTLTTFDIAPWQELDTVLKETDRFHAFVDDLSTEEGLKKHRKLIETADFIFIDAVHDGTMEENLMQRFSSIKFKTPPFLFFDDIRVWKMLKFWREINMPKLDLTSFGHWSGSGLVKWTR